MFRIERLRAWLFEMTPATQRSIAAMSAVASLYREWRVAGHELELLARGLRRRHFHEGLRALERACISLRITEGLVDVVAREDEAELGAADHLRRELLAEIRPWLAAARRELPTAATMLCTFATDEASYAAAAEALRQLDELLASAPPGSMPKRSSGS